MDTKGTAIVLWPVKIPLHDEKLNILVRLGSVPLADNSNNNIVDVAFLGRVWCFE